MIYSLCLCKKNAHFLPYIVYKHETVFADYEGIIIGKCYACGLLKTIHPLKSSKFNPTITKIKEYEDKREEFEKLFQPITAEIKKYVPKNGTILDVGCSSGILLHMLQKEGYSIKGVEPNKDAFKAAYKKFGDKIIWGTIKSLPDKDTYDCVIYYHVFEHIEDISHELDCIVKLLNKDGILIVGVPNRDNVIFTIRNKYWEYLLPNEHIWHFGAGYLIRLLKKRGFNLVTAQYFNDRRKEYPIIKRLYFLLLSFLNTILNTGEAVLIVVRKYKHISAI